MDTPFAATAHKKNVHVGGGKALTMRKPIKLKPAGKGPKALADFIDTYPPSSGVSNDVDLKPMAHGKQQIAGADLFTTKKHIVNRASKVANLNTHSVSLGNFEMGNKSLNLVLSDEEIKQCHEWTLKEAIEEMYCSTWSIIEDEESAFSAPCLGLKFPFRSDDEGYEIKDTDLHSPMSFPGPLFNTPEELDDLLGASQLVLNEYPVPEELEFKDDFGLGEEREVIAQTLLAELEKILAELDKGSATKITEC